MLSIPLLARGLGDARFGLLAVAWAAVGIFSVFDFGLGRALTRIVAERLTAHEDHRIGAIVWSASWALLSLSAALAVAGLVAAPWIVDRGLDVPAELRDEAIGVVRLLALSIPPLTHGVALRGVLEAGQRFARINQLRIPLGLATYAGPLIAIPLGADARVAVGVVVLARAAYWLAHFPALKDVAHGIATPRFAERAALLELWRVGGWITVSSVINPLLVQADRALIAFAFPIAASGWYGAASEVATKQLLFTAAMGPVLFAALSALNTARDRAAQLAERAARITLLGLLPVTLVLVLFAETGLRWWLGPAYSAEAAPVLRWLALAVFANAVGQTPYFALQSGVDARAAGLVHVIELPLYVAGLLFAATRFGAQGVAIVCLLRMAIDGVAMWAVLYARMPEARPAVWRIARLTALCWAIAGAAAWFAA